MVYRDGTRKHTGAEPLAAGGPPHEVASVSEAAALKAGGVELIVPKQKSPNATVAVARVASR